MASKKELAVQTEMKAFEKVAAKYAQKLWRRFQNPMHPDKPASYPARVSTFVQTEIDGEPSMFRLIWERIDTKTGQCECQCNMCKKKHA